MAVVPIAFLAQRATSQGAKPAAPPAPPATVKEGKVRIRNSPQGTATWDDAQGLARLTKDVVIWQVGEDFVMYAQDVTYSRTKNQAVALGKLRVDTRNSTIKGDRMTGIFDDKMLTITGNVTITSHGKQDGIVKKDDPQSKPVKITCDRLDWDYETKQAKITGNIHISQEARAGTCNLITYDEASNMAMLVGNVRFGDEKNNMFVTDKLQVFLNDNHIQSDTSVTLEFPHGQEVEGPNVAATPRPARKPQSFPGKRPINIDPSVFGTTAPPPVSTPATTPTPTPTEDEPPPAPPDDGNN